MANNDLQFQNTNRWSTKQLVTMALMGAIAILLSFVEFPIMPAASFLKLDIALVPAAEWILSATAPSPGLLEMERTYCGICMAGGVFACAQMSAASYFTGRGRTAIVFWVNLAGNILNIALDPLLIFGWRGIPGLGLACGLKNHNMTKKQ